MNLRDALDVAIRLCEETFKANAPGTGPLDPKHEEGLRRIYEAQQRLTEFRHQLWSEQ